MGNHNTRVCIVGGGPAGMVLGMLLGRAGIKTLVLEKHADFLRDFRGDTVHPSTLEIFHELGLLDRFLTLPHEKATNIRAVVGEREFSIGDFTHLPTKAKCIVFMPQWDFLKFVKNIAEQSPHFQLLMETEATDLIRKEGRVCGVKAQTKEGPISIDADLVVGADGRHSTIREKADLSVHDLGAPIDVLWMRISRKETDPTQPFGRFDAGRIFIMLNRGSYWQCAFVIKKGGFEEIKGQGMESFRRSLGKIAPFVQDRTKELKDWDQVRLLTVTVDRLENWAEEGLLCIGDCAHAMSPVGGVGINLAIQDAVATANILAPVLSTESAVAPLEVLKKVQKRRLLPARLTQAAQLQAHKRILFPVLTKKKKVKPPLVLKIVSHIPWLQRIPARLIGIGVRPEHPDTNYFTPYP